MVPQSVHPDSELLARYNQGELEPEEFLEIENHILACNSCCEKLQGLPEGSLVGKLQEYVAGGTDPESPLAIMDPGQKTHLLPEESYLEEPVCDLPGLSKELMEHPRYTIKGICGTGGMGAVYRAEHRLMNRDVALKIINPAMMNRPEAVERFRREVRAAARLSHPHIVAAYDAEQVGDLHFLVMEYVEGRTLADEVATRGPLPVPEACRYLRQAALGLQHASEQGAVHRDIKPQNLMLTTKGEIKILDFGLASLTASALDADPLPSAQDTQLASAALTLANSTMGTPDYIAPEQVQDARSVDIRADIYGLGCTLFFLLTGRPPFPDGSAMEKIRAHQERQPPDLKTFRPDVPAGLVAVYHRMVAKLPRDRFQSPLEVARALAPIAEPTRGARLRQLLAEPVSRMVRIAKSPLSQSLAKGGYLIISAALAVYYFTNVGTVTVESDSPGLTVIIEDADGGRAATLTTGTASQVTLRKGNYRVRLGGDSDPYGLVSPEDGRFSVERSEKEVITVRRLIAVPLTIEDAHTVVHVRGQGQSATYTGALTKTLHLIPGDQTFEVHHRGHKVYEREMTLSVKNPPAIRIKSEPTEFEVRPVRQAVSAKGSQSDKLP